MKGWKVYTLSKAKSVLLVHWMVWAAGELVSCWLSSSSEVSETLKENVARHLNFDICEDQPNPATNLSASNRGFSLPGVLSTTKPSWIKCIGWSTTSRCSNTLSALEHESIMIGLRNRLYRQGSCWGRSSARIPRSSCCDGFVVPCDFYPFSVSVSKSSFRFDLRSPGKEHLWAQMLCTVSVFCNLEVF